jgi:hypothetical protein
MASIYMYRPPSIRRASALARSDWVALVLLVPPALVTFVTIQQARWVNGLPPLALLALGALVAVGLSSRIGARAALAVGAALGLAAGALLGFLALSQSHLMGVGVFLMTMTWWTVFASGWLALRTGSAKAAVLPGLVALLIAVAFLPPDKTVRVLWYLMAAAPAVAYLGGRLAGSGARAWLAVFGVVIAFVATVLSISLPVPADSVRPGFVTKLEEPWYELWERLATPFARVPNRREWPRLTLPETLPFGGPIELSDDPMLLVRAAEPHKWRIAVYETYTSQGWSRVLDRVESVPLEATSLLLDPPPSGRKIEIDVRALSTMHQVVSAGVLSSSTLASTVDLSPTPRYYLNLEDEQQTYLPRTVTTVRDAMARLVAQGGGTGLLRGMLIPEGLEPVDDPTALAGVAAVERVREPTAPQLSATFVDKLVPPRSYVTTGYVVDALVPELQEADRDYPQWVTDRYLQLPPSFPDSVRELARELTAGETNQYDAAMAIQDHLGTLPYSTDVVAPPPDRDAVEWFLMVQRVGFCQYYASAMITMLRSLGIPARLVVGFAPGTKDAQRGGWLVRAENYHAWPEVYFPGHGWVEFEPTPAAVQPSLEAFRTGPEPSSLGSTVMVGESAPIDSCDDLALLCDELAQLDVPPSDISVSVPEPQPANQPWWIAWLAAAGTAAYGIVLLRRKLLPYREGIAIDSYVRMGRYAALAGIGPQAYETPWEVGARIAGAVPDAADSVWAIVDAYVARRYSPRHAIALTDPKRLTQAHLRVRSALLRHAAARYFRRPPRPRTA